MSENITREQYDNAVLIRENGYLCHERPILCGKCIGQYSNCGYRGDKLRKEIIDSLISTYESEHPEEFRTSPDPGEGWRLMKDGETIKEGDEFFCLADRTWRLTGLAGDVLHGGGFRRRVAKPPRIYDYRDVDLPEVQALIGQEVYVSDYIFTLLANEKPCYSTLESCEISTRPFIDSCGIRWQFIRAIDKPPKIKITRAELIAIAAKDRGVKPEQIVVEE